MMKGEWSGMEHKQYDSISRVEEVSVLKVSPKLLGNWVIFLSASTALRSSVPQTNPSAACQD